MRIGAVLGVAAGLVLGATAGTSQEKSSPQKQVAPQNQMAPQKQATPQKPAAPEKLKACFVYVGPRNDGAYTESHDRGRLFLQEKLGNPAKRNLLTPALHALTIAAGPAIADK